MRSRSAAHPVATDAEPSYLHDVLPASFLFALTAIRSRWSPDAWTRTRCVARCLTGSMSRRMVKGATGSTTAWRACLGDRLGCISSSPPGASACSSAIWTWSTATPTAPAPLAPTAPPAAAVASAAPAGPALRAHLRPPLAPLLSAHVAGVVYSYPATRANTSLGARLRLARPLFAELSASLPGTMREPLGATGSATLASWSSRAFFSFAPWPFSPRLHVGPVLGLSFESGSTEGIDHPASKHRVALDAGLGAEIDVDVYGPVAIGLVAWGARILAGKDFFVESGATRTLDAPPWNASGFRGAAQVGVEIAILR